MIKTIGVKYIGSKNKLIPNIISVVNSLGLENKTAIDVFSGTTRVAQALRHEGFYVQGSDLSWATEHYFNTFIKATKNDLEKAEQLLKSIPNKSTEGWLTKNYSSPPATVFQPKNTMRADFFRDYIETIDDEIVKSILTTSLIIALDKVDNTVGVQQAYLKNWCKRSYNDLDIKIPSPIYYDKPVGKFFSGDCLIVDYEPAEIAYLDPPYTQHSYATYYHIWDSIAKWDKPEVGLKTNRRIDRVNSNPNKDTSMESAWNSKDKALEATKQLIEKLPVKYVILSYNNEGIIREDELMDYLNKFDNEVYRIDYKRNIMSTIGNATKHKEDGFNTKNVEYLIVIKK